ncbi:unnamed protein product [Aphanomyces euteiches]
MGKQGPNMTEDQKLAICVALTELEEDGKLSHGAFKTIVVRFDRSDRAVSKLWKKFKLGLAQGTPQEAIKSKIKGNSGRKGVQPNEIQSRVRSVELLLRQNLRVLAEKTGIPKSVLHRAKQAGHSAQPFLLSHI